MSKLKVSLSSIVMRNNWAELICKRYANFINEQIKGEFIIYRYA